MRNIRIPFNVLSFHIKSAMAKPNFVQYILYGCRFYVINRSLSNRIRIRGRGKNQSQPLSIMHYTNPQQWLWRVTQAICFFVQRSVFSWALPAGVRIPSNAIFFCSFITSVVSLLFTLILFWLRSISETVCIVSKDKRASCVVSSRRDTDDGNRWPAAM